MSEKKILVLVILATLLLIVGGVWLSLNSGQAVTVKSSTGAKAELAQLSVDWGEVKMDDGDVEAKFTIKSIGDQPLKLFNGTTSCACTKAKIVVGGRESEYFGMHSKSKEVVEVPPGETAEVIAIFDPAFHGPSGVGPISRQMTLMTNDPNNGQVSFSIVGNVTR